jgi:hypothetical protein
MELQRECAEKGYGPQLRIRDADDPIPALLEKVIRDAVTADRY